MRRCLTGAAHARRYCQCHELRPITILIYTRRKQTMLRTDIIRGVKGSRVWGGVRRHWGHLVCCTAEALATVGHSGAKRSHDLRIRDPHFDVAVVDCFIFAVVVCNAVRISGN